MIKIERIDETRFIVNLGDVRCNRLSSIAAWLDSDIELMLSTIIYVGLAVFITLRDAAQGSDEDT